MNNDLKKHKNPKSDLSSLRQKAEAMLKMKTARPTSQLSEGAMLKLIRELEIHQIELEIQNKELVLANQQTGRITEKYTELYDFAPSGYFTLSKDGKIIELNLSGAKMIGKERSHLKNSQFCFFVSDETKPIFNIFLKKLSTSNTRQVCDIVLINNGNSPINVHLTGIAFINRKQCFISMVDITELMHASQTLLLYSEILQNMVEGVFLVRACDHVIVYTNPAIEKIFGYAPHELVGREISTVNAPTDKSPEEVTREIIQDIKNAGSWQGEIKNLKKDGTTFWSHANVSTFEDPQYGSVWISIHTDITERKLAHETLLQSEKNLQTKVKQRTRELDNLNKALKTELVKRKTSQNQLKNSIHNMKKLNTYLLKVREEERINIARIIHDDLAQLLTSLKIELTSHKLKTDKPGSVMRDSVDSMMHLVDECMVSVTSVITELRPVILDNMGLIPALKQLFSDFQRHTGISCDIRILEDSSPIKDEIATAIYRVVEEGLINIRNHSKASYVTVIISGNPSSFSIILKDNGRGITRQQSSDLGSFGITGMKERIATLGGRISFKGIHGKGTTVKLKVPVSSSKNSLSTLGKYV